MNEPRTSAFIPVPIERDRLMLGFVGFNMGFTVFDVWMAHGMSQMQTPYMAIPTLCLPLGFLPPLWLALTNTRNPLAVLAHLLGMLGCAAVGLMGFAFHMRTAVLPGGEFVWAFVIFSAPSLAPLAFAGIAGLGILAAIRETSPGRYLIPGVMEIPVGLGKRRLYFLSIGLGLAAATLSVAIEHAQGGYVNWTEWIPVVVGGVCTGAALGHAASPHPDGREVSVVFLIGAGAAGLGLLGFTFHASYDLADVGSINLERLVHGAPLFAPMLFADLGILMILASCRKRQTQASAPVS